MPFIVSNEVTYSPTSSIEFSDTEKKKPFKAIQINKDKRLEVPLTYPYIHDYDKPLKIPTVITYLDVNSDKNLRKKMINKFMNYLEEWILEDKKYLKLLQHFNVNGNKVNVSKKKSKRTYNNSKKNKIIKFILDEIIDKKDMKNILKKYVKKNKVNWYDLIDNKDDLQIFILDEILNFLKNKY
mgnify:CR=1 FL=1|jgi:hypothetical protein